VSQNGNLPDPNTAYDILFQNVHSRVFFNKCAAAGFSPSNAQEATQMLEIAGKLRQISEHSQVKQAEAQDNPYFQMGSSLDHIMQTYGLASGPQVMDVNESYKQAADALIVDPTYYNAVLSLKAAEAEQLQAQYNEWQNTQR